MMNAGCTDSSCSMCGRPVVVFAAHTGAGEKKYSVCYCEACVLGKTVPSPDDATLHELHSTQYYRNGEGVRFATPFEWLVEGMRRWRVYRLSHFVRNGRALDIGCGSGRFLRALRHSGWEVAGLELNDDTATAARTVHGLMVETALGAFTDESFDLISITHVLEHIRDPRQMLADCGRLLKPGGVIAVAVPNIDSWQARWTRDGWFHLDLPRHLWHFSEGWLSATLNECGFEVLKARRLDLAHNIFGWLQSLLNSLGLRYNRFYSFLSSDDLDTDNLTHYFSLVVSLLLLPLFIPLSLLLAVLEALFHAGGTVEIIARRTAIEHRSEGN
ncbi:MAG TPA: class I SAM-dependent methyltransferase [Desulfuromonadales bacterium]|nr:class I SAM-dependent methyltransferase [Desulfuromonadales bacterium]